MKTAWDFSFQFFTQAREVGSRAWTERWSAALEQIGGDVRAKNRSNLLIHDE